MAYPIPRATSGKHVERHTKSTRKTAPAGPRPLILGPLPFLKVQPEGPTLEAEGVGTSKPLQPWEGSLQGHARPITVLPSPHPAQLPPSAVTCY